MWRSMMRQQPIRKISNLKVVISLFLLFSILFQDNLAINRFNLCKQIILSNLQLAIINLKHYLETVVIQLPLRCQRERLRKCGNPTLEKVKFLPQLALISTKRLNLAMRWRTTLKHCITKILKAIESKRRPLTEMTTMNKCRYGLATKNSDSLDWEYTSSSSFWSD